MYSVHYSYFFFLHVFPFSQREPVKKTVPVKPVEKI